MSRPETSFVRKIPELAIPALAAAALGGSVVMAAVFASGSRKEGDKAPTPAALADEYHYDSLDADTQNSFSRLVDLAPGTVDVLTWPQNTKYGKRIR